MKQLPEARQNTDENSDQFGCTATAGSGLMAGRWLISNGENGSHWGTDADVEGWTVGTFANGTK